MSIFSLFAFAVSGVTAKFVSPDVEATKLKAEIDDLKRQLESAQLEAQWWRQHYKRELDPEVQEHRRRAQLYQAIATQQTAQSQLMMNAMNAHPYQLGAQTLDSGFHQALCHCVPGRHELLLPRRQA